MNRLLWLNQMRKLPAYGTPALLQFAAMVLLGTGEIRTKEACCGGAVELLVFVVFVGATIATVQKRAMAMVAGLMLALIFIFIRLLERCGCIHSFGNRCLAWQKNCERPYSGDRIKAIENG